MISIKEKRERLAELKKQPIFSSGSLGAVLTGSEEWTATLSSTGFKYNKQHQPTLEIPYERINSVVCKSGVIWSDIQISLVEKVIQLGGIGNADAQRLTNELKQTCSIWLSTTSTSLTCQFSPINYPDNNSFSTLISYPAIASSPLVCETSLTTSMYQTGAVAAHQLFTAVYGLNLGGLDAYVV
jgi:hypothetical protein